ncbi:unnamed protein product [Rotaria socialis]|uniref:TRPM SLOG domain-containing protein n=1 Tax=Rotaria socialis TaxID=392032 RepID=A0A819XSR7_9BILA|nr:unnamed protein product [Rotaria socialis]
MSCCSVSIALEKLKGRSSQPTWIDLVKAAAAIDANDTNKIKGKTCKIYNRESRTNNSNDVCTCNRLAKRHSYDGKCMKADVALTALELANGVIFTSQTALDCCGVLSSGCKFIRCSEQTPPKLLYPLILADCGNKKPSLIISVYGGAKYFMLTEKLEKEFMRGIVDVATIADAWILTAGLNNGVSKLVGEGISQYRLLKQYPKEVVCIGLTLWGSVSENTRIELKKANQTNSFNKEYERQLPENAKDNRETVDRHHTHCVLFDSGKLNEYLGDGQRSSFVKHICDDKNGDACYAVTIIVEGGSNTPQIIQFDIDNDRPVVVIRGSGRMADVLSNLIELTTSSNKDEQRKLRDDEIEKTLKASFPELVDDALSTCIGELKRIFNSGKRHLLHVFRLDRDVNVAETIFKAIFSANRQKRELQEKPRRERRASISATPSNSELEQERKVRKLIDLALRWNYLDGVKQLVDFQKLPTADVKSLFDNALQQNRPAFIDYFLRAGFDVRNACKLHDRNKYILNLYNSRLKPENQSRTSRVCSLFNSDNLKSISQLDDKITEFVGSFVYPIYSNDDAQREVEYSDQEMLRDIFFWAVFMNRIEIAQVLLVHLRLRICASLLASAILKSYAKRAPNVAISSESMHVLKTACFHEALNHVWYDRLAASNNHASAKPFLLLSILLAGLPAPFVIQYRQKDDRVLPETNTEYRFVTECLYSHDRFTISYMMLYEFEPATVRSPHWTEIYIIITVSTMLCEDVRQFKHNKLCKMTERHSFTGLNILSSLTALFNVLPYGLFYMGIGFRYGSANNELLFTVARILLALDLEVWYLQSLKFVIALKSLGPKLFMLKNMLPNLFEFLYIASVAIAAYGVVSRSLFKYNQVAFDGKGIFREIFYRPYWFLYGQVSDTADLETLIESANSTVVAEATATQVLLAFHMLFINILLLTLLIAVFTDTIGKVQHNTEFYWDYQRYSFVREYFDRPALAYPPLIVFPHFFRVGHFTWQMCRKFCCKKQQVGRRDDQPKYDHSGSYSPVLKIIAAEGSMLDEHWNMFESAATYSYARSSIEQKNKSTDDKNYFGNKTSLSKEYVQPMNENMNPTGIERQQEANIDLKEEIKSLRSTMIEMQIQLNKKNTTIEHPRTNTNDQFAQINQSLRWIMDAIERVKMNSKTKSRPDENISSKLSDVPTLNAQAQE